VPMEIVKELLGHSSITTTEQSYGKVLNKQISQQVAKLYHIP
jgi:integrase/recombinase XerD